MRIRSLPGLALALVALFAGCATTTRGTSSPTTTGNTASSTVVRPHHGAPKVAHPLNPEPFAHEPCRLLTSAQANQLGVRLPGVLREGVSGPDCTWGNEETGATLGVQPDLVTGDGLSRAYLKRDELKYFIEIPSIEGYPGVAASYIDGRSTGLCTIWVGITDDVMFQVQGGVSTRKQGSADACQATTIAAGMIVTTIKGGA